MTDIYLHGIETIERNDGPRPVPTIDTGVIGLVYTAPLADASLYPLNTPVLFKGFESPPVLGAGGTGQDTINAILEQATRVSQGVVGVRVEDDADYDTVMHNIIGSPSAKTGMWAFLKAETETGKRPRLLIAPGYTSKRPTDGVGSLALTAGGTNYVVPPVVSFSGGGGEGAIAEAVVANGIITGLKLIATGHGYSTAPTVTITAGGGAGATATAVLTTGAVTSVTVTDGGAGYDDDNPPIVEFTGDGSGAVATATVVNGKITEITVSAGGSGYTTAPAVSFNQGSGATATATLSTVANPVAAQLVAVANRLRAVAVVDGPNTNDADAITYRNDFNTDRLWIIDPHVKVAAGGAIVTQPAAPRVAGLQATVDYEEGFWATASNHTVQGVLGTARDVGHSLNDPSAESQVLNFKDIAVIVRAKSGGWRLMGSRAPTNDNLRKFVSVRRAHDAIIDSIELAHEPFLDKPFSITNLSDIAETVNSALRRWKALGATLGGRVWLDRGLNTAETWANGHLYISYDAEAPAPMEHITFVFNRNTGYYDDLANEAIREIERLAGTAA